MAEEKLKKPIYKKWWFWVILLIIGGIGAGSQDSEDNVATNKSSNKEIVPISVSIGELLSSYNDNEVGADVKFKGKYIQTSGIVGDIKKDIMDDLYVTIGATGEEFEIPVLQAFFLDKYTNDLANLKKRQTLEVVCKIDGLMMNVLGKKCKIVK
ncbi:OB-fold putative lipoprotein [Alphaproteobacteria bacterium]|nr:OB-fold putative lipoprotein [Alphaproteobacteria bacterium]